jgi:hypothetical protein
MVQSRRGRCPLSTISRMPGQAAGASWKTGVIAGIWELASQQSIEAECRRQGRSAVISGCVALLEGGGDVDYALVLVLGRLAAECVLGAEGGKEGYWPRVWAARGPLYAWHDRAAPAIMLQGAVAW